MRQRAEKPWSGASRGKWDGKRIIQTELGTDPVGSPGRQPKDTGCAHTDTRAQACSSALCPFSGLLRALSTPPDTKAAKLHSSWVSVPTHPSKPFLQQGAGSPSSGLWTLVLWPKTMTQRDRLKNPGLDCPCHAGAGIAMAYPSSSEQQTFHPIPSCSCQLPTGVGWRGMASEKTWNFVCWDLPQERKRQHCIVPQSLYPYRLALLQVSGSFSKAGVALSFSKAWAPSRETTVSTHDVVQLMQQWFLFFFFSSKSWQLGFFKIYI